MSVCRPKLVRRTTQALGAVAVAALVAGCGGDATSVSEAAAEPVEDSGEGSSEVLDELYAESLHEGVEPASPGTAYIEVAGERIEFSDLDCIVDETPGASRFRVEARGDADGVGHILYLDREIGPEIGWSFEDELVQLALLTTAATEEAPDRFSNSLAQHGREEGEQPEWAEGSGPSPLIRAVGQQATATGSLDGAMFADAPLEGDFVAAATCS